MTACSDKPLAARLHQRIAAEGSISVADYMEACNSDPVAGYYRTRRPIGAQGDFITAPEISQIFGELIGLWCIAVWDAMGRPRRVTVAELGPGRGTLLKDAIRAWRTSNDFSAAVSLALVETSETLRAEQQAALSHAGMPAEWFQDLHEAPEGPEIIIANEFLDALPVRQLVRRAGRWRERHIACASDGAFIFVDGPEVTIDIKVQAQEGAILELRPGADSLVAALATRAKEAPLAALFIDYGHAETACGETLQAVQAHRYADALSQAGEVDLTAHVDFGVVRREAEKFGLPCYGPLPQGEFLLKLGLAARRDALLRNAEASQKDAITSGAARLVDPREMGMLFKVLAVTSASLPAPPPF